MGQCCCHGNDMNSAAAGPLYQFDGFVLDLTRGILSDAKGEELPLRRKSFDLLHLLVENRGRLLDRDTIGQAIWSDVTVTDDSITQCVGDIRRALGDREQRMLKTMRRRGYIFDANIAAPENLLRRASPGLFNALFFGGMGRVSLKCHTPTQTAL